MSQRRTKGKNRDHLQSSLKQDRKDNSIRNYSFLFDELNPPEKISRIDFGSFDNRAYVGYPFKTRNLRFLQKHPDGCRYTHRCLQHASARLAVHRSVWKCIGVLKERNA